jgi:Ca2+-transporting ATPase
VSKQARTSLDAVGTSRQGRSKFKDIPLVPLDLIRVSQVLLSIVAVASLALGVFIKLSLIHHEGVPPVDWAGGVANIVVILIIVIVRSLNNWQMEMQFRAFNEKKEDRFVKVIHDGRERQIHAQEVVVGDVVLLELGDVIPCHGVFLSGHNVRCDESSVTGESGSVKKLSYEECITLRDKQPTELYSDRPSRVDDVSQKNTHPSSLESLRRTDCFIISGSKVIEGVGTYVVIAVGTKSLGLFIALPLIELTDAPLTSAFPRDLESTPLQIKLNDLTDAITKIGSIAGGLLFVALLVRYFFELETSNFQRYFDASWLLCEY